MAAAACERAKFPWQSKLKRSASEPPADDADVTPSVPSESGSTPGFSAARSISQELAPEPAPQSLAERWTDSLRKSRDRFRQRFSLREGRPASAPEQGEAASAAQSEEREPADGRHSRGGKRSRDGSASRAEAFLQPVRRFGKVASRSAVGKPVVRFAKTCRRDVPKPFYLIRDKFRSRSPGSRLRSDSPRPRSLSPSAGREEDEIVFAFGTAKEAEEHIYDPVGEPADPPPARQTAPDAAEAAGPEDEFAKFSRYSGRRADPEPEPEPARRQELSAAESETSSRTPTPCLKDTDSARNSRPSSRASRSEDFPKSVRFGKKRVSDDSDGVGVRFKPLSTSSSEDVGSYPGLQRVRVQLKDDASGLNLVSKFVQPPSQPVPDVVALPPIEIRQLDEPPRVLRPRTSSRTSSEASSPIGRAETAPRVSGSEPALSRAGISRAPTATVAPSAPPPPPPTPATAASQPPAAPAASIAAGKPAPSAAAAHKTAAPPSAAGKPVTPAAASTPAPPVAAEKKSAAPPAAQTAPSEPPPPEILLTTNPRPPRPPPPAPETLARSRRPLQSIDNVPRPEEAPVKRELPSDEPPPPPREPYQAKIREYWESRRALTQKPPRKKKRAEEADQRSKSADQADRAENRTIAIFGTASRPARSKRRGGESAARSPPPRPPPPAPRRPPRGRGRGAVSLLDVRDVRYADESATEESADYGDGRSYRRLLDDADSCPYRPTRSLRRPPSESTVTSKLVIGEPSGVRVQTRTEEQQQQQLQVPPARPSRGGRSAPQPELTVSRDGHNETFDSIGEGPDPHEPSGLGAGDARGSVASDGPRSLHSFQQEELGSGDELMLIVHDSERGEDRKDSAPELVRVRRDDKENRPEGEGKTEAERKKLTPGRPEYAHVRKRSSLLLKEQEANYDYPPPVPKKIGDLEAESPSALETPAAPPRRRPASLSPGRAEELDGNTTWPKRRHTVSPAAPPRTVKRNKIRSSTVPRGFRIGRAAAKPTLYHLAKQKSQEDAVDMKNRPLPPPPAPPRKKPSVSGSITAESGLSGGSVESPVPPAAPAPTGTPPRDVSPPAGPGSLSPAGSEPSLSSQATDPPSEITLRSEGSQATLTSGRDPGCESTDDEFFSLASEARTAGSPRQERRQELQHVQQPPQTQQQDQQLKKHQAELVAAAPRHVLVPHFIQRVSTSEMDAASANILDLTAGRIKVTELEVDRIYIREGRVKLIRHEDASDEEGGAGAGAGRGAGSGPAPPAAGHPLPPAGAPPAAGGAAASGGASGGARQAAADQPSSSDSSDSRPVDTGLLREIDAVEGLFRQIGSCLSDLQQAGRGRSEPAPPAPLSADRDFIPRRDCGSDSGCGSPKRKSAECEDVSPPRAPAAAGLAASTRLRDIKTTLEQVITPEGAAERLAAASAAQSSGERGAGDANQTTSAAAAADAERIYGIPAEIADAPGRRVRLSSLFSSFGKGLKKRAGRKERRPHSQFYVELDRSDSDSSGLDAQPRRRSDPQLSSSSGETVVMGGTGSTPERRTVSRPQNGPDNQLQYARVIQEFSSNLHDLCQQVSPEGGVPDAAPAPEDAPDPDPACEPPPPPPACDSSDSESDSETLHTARDLPPPCPDASKSHLVARELLTSEETFVDVLRLLNEDFRAAAQAVPPDAKQAGIPPADLAAILCHLPELQRLNEELLQDLRERLSNWAERPVVADVIVRKGPFLKLYSEYIRDFKSQCHMLSDCRARYPGFDAAVTRFEASERCRRLTVVHYMLKPVQRLPQYRLLLEDYLKRLEVGAEDYDNTTAALEVVCEVADHANKSMKEGDNFKKLLQLQERLRYTEIVKPGRSFLREGELLKLCRKGPQPRFVILLTDSLLLTRYSGASDSGPLSLDYVLPLTGMKVSVPIAATDEYQNEFSVVSTTRSFSLTASSNKERDDWVNALTGAIEKNAINRSTFNAVTDQPPTDGSKLGEKAPVWVPDDRASMCQVCTFEFTVTNRRHHCRACGKVVCGSCSMGKAPLLYLKNSSARVCDTCLDALQKDLEDADVDSQNALQSRKCSANSLGRKALRKVPKRLEVSASVAGCQMSGYLQRRVRKQWKRQWFVLREAVLYMYRASQDVVAIDSLPVLGYQLDPMANSKVKSYEGVDAQLVFRLTHDNQPPLIFHADNSAQADKWIASLQSATVLT